ncbi:hypothetical protein I4U23_021894 [Adineta vaga]|nr:hypothetical protein I4U23_021894 [Adineta vaga]
MMQITVFLFIFILSLSIKCTTSAYHDDEERSYALRDLFMDLLEEKRYNSDDSDELFNKRAADTGCQDTCNWYNGYKRANNGKGWTCFEYTTVGPDRSGAPWCKDGAVTKGSEWTLGAKYNYPEKNCCACGKGKCQDTPNWYNGYKHANNGKGWTCSEYATVGPDRSGAPWCKDGAVTKGSEWTLGAKYNYPEKNCCVCGKPSN